MFDALWKLFRLKTAVVRVWRREAFAEGSRYQDYIVSWWTSLSVRLFHAVVESNYCINKGKRTGKVSWMSGGPSAAICGGLSVSENFQSTLDGGKNALRAAGLGPASLAG